MKSRMIAEGAEKVFALIFDKGKEVIGALTSFAKKQNLKNTAYGGTRDSEITSSFL